MGGGCEDPSALPRKRTISKWPWWYDKSKGIPGIKEGGGYEDGWDLLEG